MFISLEGCEGTGKTILSTELYKQLIKQKYRVVLTKEPGGCFNSELIRGLLLNGLTKKMNFYTEALLYAADRIEHLDQVIIPALKEKKIVISDRYLDSSVAYQGYGRQLGANLIYKLNFYASKILPNLTFYIDIDPFISLQRLQQERQNKIDQMDLNPIDFHQRVRKGYLQIMQNNLQRVMLIDGNQSLGCIFKIMYEKILSLLTLEK